MVTQTDSLDFLPMVAPNYSHITQAGTQMQTGLIISIVIDREMSLGETLLRGNCRSTFAKCFEARPAVM